MKKIELLAPAGSMDSLIAAVQAGCDAVYLGGNKFSARAYASNFDDETMIKAIDYCHIYGVKVYVTLNTLLKDSEIEEALEYSRFLYEVGVDALIIQDMGLFYLLKERLPDLEIHASTQMTVHNGEGALFLKKLGFTRIVLARELSIDEIKRISLDFNVETEVFVHGALCISYSGQCLMSSVIGGRSGNRGRCAQPCRLPYNLINKINKEESKGYLLSPKDICTIENIKEIIESGTSSLKIEGRMKRPEYVAGVIDIYRRAIDSVYEGIDFDFEKEKKVLMQLFNREGFSKAYLFGNVGKDMMSYNFPKNTGVSLGKVLKDSSVELNTNLNLQDGVRVGDKGFTVSKIIKDGMEVQEAFKGDVVKIKPSKFERNDVLYKTADNSLLNKLSSYYKEPFNKKINLKVEVEFKVNEPISIRSEYDGKKFIVQGDVVQKALRKPLDKERINTNLEKTADTPFKLDHIEFISFEEGFLPMSAVNSVRRGLIEEIENYIINKSKRELNDFNTTNNSSNFESTSINSKKEQNTIHNYIPKELACVKSKEQLKAVLESNISSIGVDLFNKNNNIDIYSVKNKDIYLKVPNIIRDCEFEAVCNSIEKNISIISGIITNNIGIISRFKNKTSIIGDYKLNLFNKYAWDLYKSIINGAYVSIELNKGEVNNLLRSRQEQAMGSIVYGKYELMVSEYCPIGSVFGGKSSEKTCKNQCSTGEYVLKDRKGEEFRVLTDKFCRSHIYNSVPTNLIDQVSYLENKGIKGFRLDFIDESYEETVHVLNNFSLRQWNKEFNGYTKGHYKRGVE